MCEFKREVLDPSSHELPLNLTPAGSRLLDCSPYLRNSTQIQQAMKVVSRRTRMAAVKIGQTTGLCVLAMSDTKPLTLASLLLDISGGTQQTITTIRNVSCSSATVPCFTLSAMADRFNEYTVSVFKPATRANSA